MTQETKHYTMLSTQRGVRHGELHPVTFEKGKSYAIDDLLAEQFGLLGATEDAKGNAEISEPVVGHTGPDVNWVGQEPINEGVLDEDPAVLRASPIPVEEVIAQNDEAAAKGNMTPTAAAVLGREDIAAEGEIPDQGEDDADQKVTAKKTKKK